MPRHITRKISPVFSVLFPFFVCCHVESSPCLEALKCRQDIHDRQSPHPYSFRQRSSREEDIRRHLSRATYASHDLVAMPNQTLPDVGSLN
ncbi:uncharacterized protein BCR38DRAFT_419234 [Pseudomassariella vexata]|uniref:Secreted protein n=1 Tax=Pseudomassariella vexata TaxID=1141098 RepID=A0A1Y2ED44_9PEZI|nr:uncharacterized protein BCR38DRAFT_419234 [Pseudomassariella vexata]ORY69480.1 hypothetical protein BCR38DRAFT_419234 [Pseudomassariella vexata]